MAKPILTPSQIVAVNADIVEKTTKQSALSGSAAAQDDTIARKGEIDDAFKALFDYYNDDIIGQYDAEGTAIDGVFIISPVVEADILAVAENPPSGRLLPVFPVTDIVRIDEFDGGGTSTTTTNEQQHIADQAVFEDILENGVSGTAPTLTGTSQTSTALTAASTSLSMTDAVGPMSFAVGDVFVIQNGGTDAAVVEVTIATDDLGGDPPYNWTLDIIVRVAPTGTLASGSDATASFTGFTNAERTTKTASDSNEQPLMDSLITSLEAELASRQSRMSEQSTALTANDDPDGVTEITTAQTNITTSDTFITAYLVGTDISDTGLASLTTERGIRSGQLTTRLTEISDNYTMQTEDYYEQRYDTANNRGNTTRGSLREKEDASNVKEIMLDQADNLQDSIDVLNALLP